MLLKLALRNVLRNGRRSAITLPSSSSARSA
jgi:hypothetical protein